MLKFYIATKLENHEQHRALRIQLEERGHTCTYDWTEHGPVYKEGLVRIRHVAHKEFMGVCDSDFVVVLMPGGRGTHVELGMAIARNIPVFIVTDNMNYHEATDQTCAFYRHPRVQLFECVDDMIENASIPFGGLCTIRL